MMKNVGDRVQKMRNLNNLSLQELCDRTGLSDDQLRKIEDNSFIPSLGALIKISRALGIRLGTLIDDHDKTGPVINRGNDIKKAHSLSNQDDHLREHMQFFSLAHQKSSRHMEPFIIDVHPGDPVNKANSTHEGEEFLYVLQGEVKIKYGTEEYVLKEGDSMYYDSIIEHTIQTLEDQNARLLVIIYVPL